MATFVPLGAVVALCSLTSCLRDSTNMAVLLGYASLVLSGCLGLWFIWKGFLWPNYFSPLRHLPTVPDSGVISTETLRLYTEARGVPQCEWVNKLGRIPQGLVRYRSILGTERLLVVSPEALAEVLVNKSYDFRKPTFVVTQLEQVLGRGILLAEGNDHRAQRKSLQPAFAFRHVKELYGIIWTATVRLLMTMTEHVSATSLANPTVPTYPADGPRAESNNGTITVDIANLAIRATLDIIGIAGMGQDFGAIRNPDSALHQTYKLVFQPSKEAIFLGVLRLWLPDWLVNRIPLKRNVLMGRSVQMIRSLCRRMIHETRSRQGVDKAGGNEYSHGKNILTVALSAGAFTEESLVDQLMTFLAAGHETTATALTWAIYIICVHPDIQEKLRSEVRSCLPSPSSSSSLSTSAPGNLAALIDSGMPYLNSVCLEVLRYFPPVPVTFREATKHTSILQTLVPAGTIIVLAPRVTNRDSSLWGADAQVFNPDRWLSPGNRDARSGTGSTSEDRNCCHSMQDGKDVNKPRKDREERTNAPKESSPRSNFAAMTFLHGPRSCIGQSFAQAELAILLAVLVGRFEFNLADKTLANEKNIRISRGATARPDKGLLVKVRAIEGW